MPRHLLLAIDPKIQTNFPACHNSGIHPKKTKMPDESQVCHRWFGPLYTDQREDHR